MTNIDSPSVSSLNADQVEDYLRRHPSFLIDRPEILTILNIPHGTPADIPSLIERQVALLRRERGELKKQLANSADRLQARQELTCRVLDVSLDLLEADTLDALCGTLQEFVRQYYDADQVSLSLFLNRALPEHSDFITILGRNDKLRILLVELFNRQQPLFDSLQAEHLTLLFGAAAENVSSTALLPLFGHDWDGLLALGSYSRDRYRRGQSFELLKYLVRITAFKLDHCLRPDTD